jgi:hypothetical protein
MEKQGVQFQIHHLQHLTFWGYPGTALQCRMQYSDSPEDCPAKKKICVTFMKKLSKTASRLKLSCASKKSLFKKLCCYLLDKVGGGLPMLDRQQISENATVLKAFGHNIYYGQSHLENAK